MSIIPYCAMSIKIANKYFKTANYQKAISAYQEVISKSPELRKIAEFNIQISKNRLGVSPLAKKFTVAVLFHAYHVDEVDVCIQYIKNIPFDFKLIVTTDFQNSKAIAKKINGHGLSYLLLTFENKGRDILPFIRAYETYKAYDLVCKIHTKKGDSGFSKTWKTLCYKGVLDTPEYIEELCHWMIANPLICCAGSEHLYGDNASLVGKNERHIESIKRHVGGYFANKDSGFFMGSIFWFKPEKFQFIPKLAELSFENEEGVNDGRIEHAIERTLIGGYFQKYLQVALTRPQLEGQNRFKNVCASRVGNAFDFHKYFDMLEKSIYSNSVGSLDISRSHISGWCGSIEELDSKQIALAINGRIFYEGNTTHKRHLPKHLQVNTKNPGFSIEINKYLNPCARANNSKISLIDLHSGKEITSKVLPSGDELISPLSSDELPLDAADSRGILYLNKKVNSVEELKSICSTKVSIIMPTFNRCREIVFAISSVLCQTHNNFELIIVDDGSTDSTKYTIDNTFNDERIVYVPIANGGVSRARNVGLQIASGEYIFFLDSDNSYSSNFIECMLMYMKITKLDNAYCYSAVHDSNIHEINRYTGEIFDWNKFIKQNFIDLNCFCCRANSGDRVFFDEKLRRLVDWDYIWRQISNKSIGFLPIVGPYYNNGPIARITNTENRSKSSLIDLISTIIFKNKKLLPISSNYYLDRQLMGQDISTTLAQSDVPKKYDICTFLLTYNHEKYISMAIESAISQDTQGLAHEIFILDDFSSDKTLTIAYEYAKKYPNITVLPNKHNVGISKNLARGLKLSNASYIAILEGDDYWHSNNHLKQHYMSLECSPRKSCSFNKIRCLNVSTGDYSYLQRQLSIKSKNLTFKHFMDDNSWNLIANFSSTFWRADLLKSMPAELMEPRFNEIVTACYFSKLGSIGYIDECHTTYRVHEDGLWSGASQEKKLRSSIDIRKTLLKIAPHEFTSKIKNRIDLMESQLKKMKD